MLDGVRFELEQQRGEERKGVWVFRFREQNLVDRPLLFNIDEVLEFVVSCEVQETVVPIKPVPGLERITSAFLGAGIAAGFGESAHGTRTRVEMVARRGS